MWRADYKTSTGRGDLDNATEGFEAVGRLCAVGAALAPMLRNTPRSFPYREEVLVGAEVNPPVRDGGRRVDRLAHRVGVRDLVRRPGLDHERIAVFARHRDVAAERHRRSHEARRLGHAASFVLQRPGPGIEA